MIDILKALFFCLLGLSLFIVSISFAVFTSVQAYEAYINFKEKKDKKEK